MSPSLCVWSDPGIVFDERNRRKENPGGSVNYWTFGISASSWLKVPTQETRGRSRKLPSEGQGARGAYKKLVEGGRDLVELTL